MTSLAEWTMADGPAQGEPEVRVGVVLPPDGAKRLRLTVPDAEYRLRSQSSIARPARSVTVEFDLVGAGVRATLGGQHPGVADAWTLTPVGPTTGASLRDDRGDVPAVGGDGIIVGRGFHWQTTTRQWLPGELSVRRTGDQLLLAARLPMEDYLTGVITAEMSGECPVEFLKAQCIVARSWALARSERKHEDLGLDLCNDDCCQRYQGISAVTPTARLAVRETRGQVLAAGGTVVDANYSKSCGGIVETPEAVWGAAKPGLAALVDAPPSSPMHRFRPVTNNNIGEYVTGAWLANCDAYCSPRSVDEATLPRYLGQVDRGGGLFRWTVTHQRPDLEAILRSKGYAPDDLAEVTDLVVTRRGVSGRATELDIVYAATSGSRAVATIRGQYNIRDALHDAFLFSSALNVRVDRKPGQTNRPAAAVRFHLDGAGWGHGAGLCQIGALGMALAGCDHQRILDHYFPGAELSTAYA